MTSPDTKAIRAQMEALAGFTAGPWYTHNQPGDWGLGGAHSIHVADANPYEWDQCIAHVEYQTPYCLGEKPSVIDASRTAARNASLIAAAPDMRETILALCDALDKLRAENERLQTIIGNLHAVEEKHRETANAHFHRANRLQVENERLRAALEPFASEADMWGDLVPDDHAPLCVEMGHTDGRYYGSAAKYTVGDLRLARAALAQKEGK